MSVDILIICLCIFGKISFYLSWSVLTLTLTQTLSASTAFYTLTILAHLFGLILYIGWLDIEFFFLLYLLIYVSALAILFLFTLFFLPIDSAVVTSNRGNDIKMYAGHNFDRISVNYCVHYIEWLFISGFFFLFNFLDSIRIDLLQNYISMTHIRLSTRVMFNLAVKNASSHVPTWLDLLQYEQYILDNKTMQASLDIQSLGWLLYERFPIVIILVLVALLVVLFGTLDWLRKTEKYLV